MAIPRCDIPAAQRTVPQRRAENNRLVRLACRDGNSAEGRDIQKGMIFCTRRAAWREENACEKGKMRGGVQTPGRSAIYADIRRHVSDRCSRQASTCEGCAALSKGREYATRYSTVIANAAKSVVLPSAAR